jgi:hypothetical protein
LRLERGPPLRIRTRPLAAAWEKHHQARPWTILETREGGRTHPKCLFRPRLFLLAGNGFNGRVTKTPLVCRHPAGGGGTSALAPLLHFPPAPTSRTCGTGTRVAERVQEPGATLLLGEFFEVNTKEDGRQAEAQTHQAMEFANTEEGVAVKGTCFATARIVLGCRGLPGRRAAHKNLCVRLLKSTAPVIPPQQRVPLDVCSWSLIGMVYEQEVARKVAPKVGRKSPSRDGKSWTAPVSADAAVGSEGHHCVSVCLSPGARRAT